jgi:hypothetical protein
MFVWRQASAVILKNRFKSVMLHSQSTSFSPLSRNQVSLRWKDVTAITKEKTALVIPNAILVCTEGEKLFFTSFGARDKTYLMLFRVWQNALLDQVGHKKVINFSMNTP